MQKEKISNLVHFRFNALNLFYESLHDIFIMMFFLIVELFLEFFMNYFLTKKNIINTVFTHDLNLQFL